MQGNPGSAWRIQAEEPRGTPGDSSERASRDGGGSRSAPQAAGTPAPSPARGPVAASPAGGSRPRAALGMLRRRPGRAASELPRRPHARPTWALRAPGCCRYGPARPPRAGARALGGRGLGVVVRRHPAPTRTPGARRTRERAGWRARRPRGPSSTSRRGRGRWVALTWRDGGERARAGPGGARPGLASGTRRPRRRGVGVRSGWAGATLPSPCDRRAAREVPAPPRPQLRDPRGRTAHGERAKRGGLEIGS